MAVVHSLDGVRFVTTGHRGDAVIANLAGYVGSRCDDVLSADAGTQVRTLLADGNVLHAIMVYFERVGERWDDERLEWFTAATDGIHWTPADGLLSHVTR